MMTLTIDPAQPDQQAIETAADYIKLGKLVVHPTDTLYGLAGHVGIHRTVQKIFEIKQREETAPLSALIGEPDQLEPLVAGVPDAAAKLMDQFWPGPVTLIFPAAETVNPVLIGFGNTIGLRLPDHALSRELCRASRTAITSTSVNLRGQQPAAGPADIDPKITQHINCLIDGGDQNLSTPSTLIDTTVTPVRVLRVGAVSLEDIAACVEIAEPEQEA
jgi:L-threonylcarbamoyladenylate synthase